MLCPKGVYNSVVKQKERMGVGAVLQNTSCHRTVIVINLSKMVVMMINLSKMALVWFTQRRVRTALFASKKTKGLVLQGEYVRIQRFKDKMNRPGQ